MNITEYQRGRIIKISGLFTDEDIVTLSDNMLCKPHKVRYAYIINKILETYQGYKASSSIMVGYNDLRRELHAHYEE